MDGGRDGCWCYPAGCKGVLLGLLPELRTEALLLRLAFHLLPGHLDRLGLRYGIAWPGVPGTGARSSLPQIHHHPYGCTAVMGSGRSTSQPGYAWRLMWTPRPASSFPMRRRRRAWHAAGCRGGGSLCRKAEARTCRHEQPDEAGTEPQDREIAGDTDGA